MNWGDLLVEVREDIEDAGETPKWGDALLFIYLKDAVRDYTFHFPFVVERLELEEDSGSYDLPEDFRRERAVESPLNTTLEKRGLSPGVKYGTRTSPLRYYIQGNQLFLDVATTEGVFLTYEADRPLPDDEEDTETDIDIPASDIELIRLYIRAKLQERVRARSAQADRFRVAGSRADNPLIEEVENLSDTYKRKVAERKGGKAHLLHRVGRPR
jgi:hypothetical protein